MGKKNWILIIILIVLVLGAGGFIWWIYKKGGIQPTAEPTTTEAINYQVYATNKTDNWLCRWTSDLLKHDCTLPTGLDIAGGVDLASDDKSLYILNNKDDGWLAKIDLDTWAVTKKVAGKVNGVKVGGVGLTVDTKYVYVVNDSDDWVHRWDKDLITYDTNNPASETEHGGNALASDGTSLYITDQSGNWIRQVDIATWKETKKIGTNSFFQLTVGANGIAVDSQNVYTIHDGDDRICRWDKGLTKSDCERPTTPAGINRESGGNALSSNGTILIVSDQSGNWLQTINVASWQVTKVVKGALKDTPVNEGDFKTFGGTGVFIDKHVLGTSDTNTDTDTDTNTNTNTQTQSQTQSQSTSESTSTTPSATATPSTSTTPSSSATTGPELPLVGTGILSVLLGGLYLVSRKIKNR